MDKYSVLKNCFGYDSFKYPQDKIIDMVMAGKEVIGLLPTGFGKSIIFQVLAFMQEGVSIIISPLIALMEDQVNALKKKGILAAFLNSNLSYEEQFMIYQNTSKNKYKLIYVSPERLENQNFLSSIKKVNISMIVVDEAHTILWAEGFRAAFGNIYSFIEKQQTRPKILALTATATNFTTQKIKDYLHLRDSIVIDVPMDRPNLFYRVVSIENKLPFLLKYLSMHNNEKGIIYCLTRREVEALHNKLLNLNYQNVYYHGGLDVESKIKNQELFTLGQSRLMICTNAFGMGIDIPDIRFVIEYNLPQSLEDLTQQMGRASRDGGYGEGIVLFSFKDIDTVKYFIEQQEKKTIRKEHQKKLDALVDYCLTKKCRHSFICSYFGQKVHSCKGGCDNCKKKVDNT
ncbi:MAG: RecQ family ATP-dependent DNA helicase [Anaeroplasma bactoclasticum]|nr:RecQ family ATP-dependent DNA helicase [Anaeroplasma bactoclasticum]